MPIRFESPSLGGRGDSYLDPKGWQVGVSYRRLFADEFFVGRDERPTAGPFGKPLEFDIHSFTLNTTYAITERLTASLYVPYSTGKTTRGYADGKQHANSASGIGDISLVGSAWLWYPLDMPRGNISLGLGVKAPTGTNTARGYSWSASGDSVQVPVDQAIQLGDGGWGLIFQAEGFRKVRDRSFVYASGHYLATTREQTEVVSPRSAAQRLAVPDIYNVRAGVTSVIAPRYGVTLSLGMRQDATTRADLFGGKDMAFRRPAVVGYYDPGLSVTKGRNTFYANVPIRAYQNFRVDYSYKPGDRVLGGDLAKYLIFTGFTHRF